MIIQSIYEAIQARYNESSLPALLEGFYFESAPQDTTGTYATWFMVTGTQTYTMSTRSEEITIQISVWDDSDSPGNVTAAAEQVMLWFDDCSLSVAGGSHIRIDRDSYNLLRDPDGGWQYQIDYSIQVQEA